MRKALTLLAVTMAASVMACDYCNLYMGVTPVDFENRVALLYRLRWLDGYYQPTQQSFGKRTAKHLGHLDEDSPGDVKELYQVMELRGRYFFSDRVYGLVSLPLVNNYRSFQNTTQFDIYGVGDPTLLLYYRLFDTSLGKDASGTFHRVDVGGGVKAPIGATGRTYRGEEADLDLQPGTGSIDFLASAQYTTMFTSGLGFSLDGVYKMNGENPQGYAYGNVWNSNLNVFYRFRYCNWTIIPKTGLAYENAAKDTDESDVETGSGGEVLFASGGVSLFRDRWTLSLDLQKGVHNDLPDGQLPPKFRVIAGVYYNF